MIYSKVQGILNIWLL